jgi:GalNAc-alpha-(1->4)-GalNAc-alpha-(1->3)-diNAcBac-PP-undecaprenol alpha-1,4-N-acetyl-D-galactosaminyltransferase
MRILFLVSSMETGGAERVAATLSNAWASKGHIVTLMPTFSGRGKCFYKLSKQVNLIYLADKQQRVGILFIDQILRLVRLRKYIRKERPDVILCFLSNVNVGGIIASIGSGTPVIISERVDSFVMPFNLSLKIASKLTYPFASALVVQTHSLKKKFTESSFSNKFINVISNPIPENIYNCKKLPHLRCKKILSVGRLCDQKQFDVLIRSFSGFAKTYPEWTLRIVGDGKLRKILWKQICDLEMQDRIELSGISTDISKDFLGASIFVLTSKFEGFPNAMLEAMAIGLPCVAFDCPSGPSDLSGKGQFAFLVPLGDEHQLSCKLIKLMSSFNLRKSLGNKGRYYVRSKYSIVKILDKWDHLFSRFGLPTNR